MNFALTVVALLLLGVLTLVSYIERVYTEMGKFLSRNFEENVECFEKLIEPRLKMSRARIALSIALLEQLTTAALALIVAFFIFAERKWTGGEIAQAALVLILLIVIFNRLIPYVLFTRTKGTWVSAFVLVIRGLLYLALPVTIVLGFTLSVAALAEERTPDQAESPSEAVDALIEAGEEEGILEESDRELIQSVVEFGDKTVREVMTARPEIFAVPLQTTVEQFVELLRSKPYSRVPVYDGTIDNVKGLVLAHDVLQVADAEARATTVEKLLRPVHFAPESQRVRSLMRELQKENNQMAVVLDEYGGVAGIVTIEDMVEEIVGEIRDEHEAKADVIREGENTFVVPGTMDVDRLDPLLGIRPEGHEATTVGGLVSELLGHIPAPGEVAEADGLRLEVLESTDRRVERLRVSKRQGARTSAPAAASPDKKVGA